MQDVFLTYFGVLKESFPLLDLCCRSTGKLADCRHFAVRILAGLGGVVWSSRIRSRDEVRVLLIAISYDGYYCTLHNMLTPAPYELLGS